MSSSRLTDAFTREQHLRNLESAILVLRSRTNRYEDLKQIVPRALGALEQIQPGQLLEIS